ncbi:MAG: DUF4136 domain-containing protein [Vicinamibacterales bacterium]
MTRFLRASLFLVPALALAACAPATMSVSSHVDPSANFTAYKTFSWGPADALPTGDPRLDANPQFKDQFQGAVERELSRKGLTQVTTGKPDLLIHYHANISERLNVTGIDRPYGYCIGQECSADVTTYEAGTLVLDVVDAKTNKLIWRGWSQDPVQKMLDSPDEMTRQINKAVPQMMKQYPKAF